MSVQNLEYEQKIQRALESADSNESALDPNIIEFSTGVRLSFIGISIFRIQNILSHPDFKEPPVPEVYDEERKRMMQVPNERWVKEVETVQQQRGLAMLDAIIAMGTKVEFIPTHMPKPNDQAWLDEIIEFSKVEPPKSEKGRYLLWVKYVAMKNEEDFKLVPNLFNKSLGVSEQQIASAMADNFPNN